MHCLKIKHSTSRTFKKINLHLRRHRFFFFHRVKGIFRNRFQRYLTIYFLKRFLFSLRSRRRKKIVSRPVDWKVANFEKASALRGHSRINAYTEPAPVRQRNQCLAKLCTKFEPVNRYGKCQ